MSDAASEVGRYAERTRYPGLWMLAHLGLVFAPFLVAFVIAGNTRSPVDVLAMLAGVGGIWVFGVWFRERSAVWTAFAMVMLFPKQEGERV